MLGIVDIRKEARTWRNAPQGGMAFVERLETHSAQTRAVRFGRQESALRFLCRHCRLLRNHIVETGQWVLRCIAMVISPATAAGVPAVLVKPRCLINFLLTSYGPSLGHTQRMSRRAIQMQILCSLILLLARTFHFCSHANWGR